MYEQTYDVFIGRENHKTKINMKQIYSLKRQILKNFQLVQLKKKKNSNTIINDFCKDLSDNYQLCYNKSDNTGSVIVDIKISQDNNGICVSDN